MADDLFKTDPSETPVIDPAKDYLTELVGDDKKFKTPQDLARAKAESDAFIIQILREKAEVTDALKKRINEEEFLTKLEQISRQATPPAAGEQPPAERGNEQPLTPDTIELMLEQRDAKKRSEANLAEVTDKLTATFGTDYKRRVQTQAKALGVDTSYLTEAAAKNPSAFYRLMGMDQTQQQPDTDIAPPRSSISSSFSSGTPRKNFAHFQKLRQEKGERHYFSVPVQQEIWKEAKAQGDAFFQ